MPAAEEVKLYFDYKSPFAYLAMRPAFELSERYSVAVRWIPYQLRIKGTGERSVYSEWKVRYSYMDARRVANRHGSLTIRGPRKVYDSTPALVGGLYAERGGFFRAYSECVFTRFFERRLEIDQADEVAAVIDELGGSSDDYRAYLAGEGIGDFDSAMREAHEDRIFGVPIFVLRGELFWGHDRIALLQDRLTEHRLAR